MELTKRQTIQMSVGAHEKLGLYAKRFGLTRVEVLSAVLENVNIEEHAKLLTLMRLGKVQARQANSEEREKVRKLVEGMTPAQLEAVLKLADKVQS
jgi:hypothetical protein